MRKLSGGILIVFCISTISLFCFTMCSENSTGGDENDPTAMLVSHTDCKTSMGNIRADDHNSSEDCIDYAYDTNGTLLLTHVNTGFNCCPGELTADITIADNIITISEHEAEAGCHCNCLFDIEYRIENLSAGIYTIKIIEPYAAEAEPLEFTADFTSAASGSFCVTRTFYPWGDF